MASVLLALPGLLLAGALIGQGVEIDTIRHGATYARVPAEAAPVCAQACADDARCRSWTLVAPGLQAATAMCELKAAAPAPARSPCCVSGLKGAGLAPRPAARDLIVEAPAAVAQLPPAPAPALPPERLRSCTTIAQAPAGAFRSQPRPPEDRAGRPQRSAPVQARSRALSPDPADALAGGPG